MDNFTLDIKTKILRSTFLTNLEVLKKYMRPVYDFIKEHKPTNVKLTIDDAGEVNMVSNGALVYEKNPRDSSIEQLETFLKSPKFYAYSCKVNEANSVFKHEQLIHQLNSRRQEETENFLVNTAAEDREARIDFLAMIGCGLGYHIEELNNRIDLKYFFLFEPDPDCFYCMLHTIDLKPIIESCIRNGGYFTVRLGGTSGQFVNQIQKLFQTEGFYNVARIYLYRHYLSKENDESFELINNIIHRYSSGWGFFEDEIISVTHTLSNLKQQFPVLRNEKLIKNKLKDKPAFLVANGPSLDSTIDYLKKNKLGAFIISCGTALKVLLKHGIVPDAHVEIERTAALMKWVEGVGDLSALKDVRVVALNPVFTDLLKLFKNAHLMMKPQDGGSDFLNEFINRNEYPNIPGSNPTVSNGAVALAIQLGFSDLYFFGMDLGFKDTKYHHSKDSVYFEEDFENKVEEAEYELKVPGNFGGEVYTSYHFDSSKSVIEITLEGHSARRKLNCFNVSDGVQIIGASPVRPEKLNDLPNIKNKANLVDQLYDSAFSNKGMLGKDFDALFDGKLQLLEEHLGRMLKFVEEPITSRADLSVRFSLQHKYVESLANDAKTRAIYRFIKGTMFYGQSVIMTNSYYYLKEDAQIRYINESLELLADHYWDLFEELKATYNKPSKI